MRNKINLPLLRAMTLTRFFSLTSQPGLPAVSLILILLESSFSCLNGIKAKHIASWGEKKEKKKKGPQRICEVQ